MNPGPCSRTPSTPEVLDQSCESAACHRPLGDDGTPQIGLSEQDAQARQKREQGGAE